MNSRWSDRTIDRAIGVSSIASSRVVDAPAGAIATAAAAVQVASVAAVAEEAGGAGAAAIADLIADLPEYADDAEATAAGVPIGGLYRRNDGRLVQVEVP